MRNKQCRTCKEKKLKEKPEDEEYIDPDSGEIWKPIIGGWISSFGKLTKKRSQSVWFLQK